MKTIHVSLPIASFVAFSLLAGCGTYRVVKKTATGGEVALQGSADKAREQANGYMAAHCPSGYDVLEEGEAVIGSDTTARTARGSTILGVPTQNTTASTTDKREWRIKYQCKGATATPPTGGGVPTQGTIRELVVRF